MVHRSRRPLTPSHRLRCHRPSRKWRNPYPPARPPTSAPNPTRPSLSRHRPSPTRPLPTRRRRRPCWQGRPRRPVRSQPARRRAPCLPTPPICGPQFQQPRRPPRRRARRNRRCRAPRPYNRQPGRVAQLSRPSCVKQPRRRSPQARPTWERKPSPPPPPGQLPGRHRLTPVRERACSGWWPLLPDSSPSWPGRSETARTTPPCW